MKKLIIALFSLFLLSPSFAAFPFYEGTIDEAQRRSENGSSPFEPEFLRAAYKYFSVSSELLNPAFRVYFPNETNYGNALAAYHAAVAGNGGKGILPKQLWDVCMAGGLDIKSSAGKQECDDFAFDLMPIWQRACTGDGMGECIKAFSWTNTNHRQAMFMAKVYLEHQKKRKDVVCTSSVEQSWNDDYVACRVLKPSRLPRYYELQFDDLYESVDSQIENNMKTAICIIYGKPNIVDCLRAENCDAVDKIAREFGWRAFKKNHGCYIESYNITDESELVNEYAGIIDNFVYSSGKDQTQIQAASSLDELIKKYCASKLAPTPVTSFSCAKTHRRWIRGVFEDNEDVLTCHINGKRVDFVFDDLTQQNVTLLGQSLIEGSTQALGCRAVGGVFDGEHCADLTQDMCAQVAQLNLAECPDCKAAYWDAEKQICMLPESKQAKNAKATVKVLTNTGLAVVTLVVTVASGGSVLMITAAATATLAAATSDGVKLMLDSDASDWVVEMNKIQTPEAADAFLRAHLEEIMGADHLNEQRRNGLDEMLTRVLGKASDTYFKEIVSGCVAEIPVKDGGYEVYYDKNLSTCALNPANGKNTKSTIIQVADAVQFIAGVVMIVAGLTQTAQAISTRVTSVTDKIDDLKNTGWIYRNGQWYNQTTGEVIDKLPVGVPGWDPNPALRGGGRWRGLLYGNGNTGSFTRKADLIRWVTENRIDRVVSTVWNPNWAVVAAGTANAIAAPSGQNLANVNIPDKTPAETPAVTPEKPTAPVVVTPEQPSAPVVTPEKPTAPVVTPGKPSAPAVTPEQPTAPVVTPEQPTAPVDDTPTYTPAPVDNTPTYTPASVEPARDIKPHEVKNNGAKTALIATAAIAGTIGAGWLIGGLIGKDDDDKKPSAPAVTQNQSDLEQLMRNAGGVIGNQNGASLRLISLPTTINSVAPIVTINGYAVVVVDYRGIRLPYYMNTATMRWEPLLGIGINGGWFNVYPNAVQSGIPVIDSVAGHLGRKLSPNVVSAYVGNFNGGISFPMAGPGAYTIINAEFVNGVVQTNAGVMSPSDKLLYDNNYNLMRAKLQ